VGTAFDAPELPPVTALHAFEAAAPAQYYPGDAWMLPDILAISRQMRILTSELGSSPVPAPIR
jgi:hypothetical protein